MLKDNELDSSKQKEVELVFRRPRGSNVPYTEIIYGDIKKIEKYSGSIKKLVDDRLIK